MTREEALDHLTANKNFAVAGKEIVAQIKAGDQAKDKAVEHYKAAGLLLVAVSKQHPEGFTAFLTRSCAGLARSRAYELMQIAGGAKTADQIRAETKKRVDRHRAKKQRPLQGAVTDTPNEGATAHKTEDIPSDPLQMSERAFAEFRRAVDTSMPHMTPAIRRQALVYAKAVIEQLQEGAQS